MASALPAIDTSFAQPNVANKAAQLGSTIKNTEDSDKIKKTAKEFEAVFLTQMLKQMYAGVETDPIFGGGSAEETFKTFLFDEYGKVMAKSGGIGIADSVQKELMNLQMVK
jgi:peptidoglycan hydrolase FlgJ